MWLSGCTLVCCIERERKNEIDSKVLGGIMVSLPCCREAGLAVRVETTRHTLGKGAAGSREK